MAPVNSLFPHLSRSIKEELNDEPFTPELLACVKVHLLRRIMYETKIPLHESQIERAISK